MAQLISVKLSRFDGSPWGFRLQGGKDFGTPLVVQKVNGGSPAEAAGLRAGDAVIRVNSTDMFNLRHKDAQDVIVRAGNNFEMTVQRGGSTWKPSVTPLTSTLPSPAPAVPVGSINPVTKTSLAAKKQDAPLIGSGHNFSPKPFLNGTSDGSIKSIVNKQYNSPVGIYSEETIAETLSAQAEVLAGGVLGVNFKKNEKNYNAENSEVFKMVQEADKEPKTPEPAEPIVQSGVITPSSPALTGLRSVSAPETKQPQTPTPQTTLPPGQNICADCERLIVGVFVRIKDKNLHVECFKCSTCGTSLKNVGYYNINNKLYCDIHAKMVARQNAPAGLVPITVPPGAKAPAGTISAALANIGAPLSPPLSNHGSSPQPFSAYNRSSPLFGNQPRRMPLASNGYAKNGDCNGESKTFTSTLTIQTGGTEQPTRPGISPVKLPASRSVQAPTSNNLIGPKPFGVSTPTQNFTSVPSLNTGNSTLPRPQSQTVTETFEENLSYYESVKRTTTDQQPPQSQSSQQSSRSQTPAESHQFPTPSLFGQSQTSCQARKSRHCHSERQYKECQSSTAGQSRRSQTPSLPPRSETPSTIPHNENPCNSQRTEGSSNPSSVRSKSRVWPPSKTIEDITYPTASPIYIDPNPVLERKSRQTIRERRASIEACEKVLRKRRSVSADQEDCCCREYNRGGEDAMDRVSCPGPVYRRVELVDATSRQSRSETTSRPSSTDSMRRSLTPTRIVQPVPKPWTATVSTASNIYEQSYPIPPPEHGPEAKMCKKYMHREVCQREKLCERGQTMREEERAYRSDFRRSEQTICPKPPLPPPPSGPKELRQEIDSKVIDLTDVDSKTNDLSGIVPPDVSATIAIPRRTPTIISENAEHDLVTEFTEEDVGDTHITRTTTFEKTVESRTPERSTTPIPQIEEVKAEEETSSLSRQVEETEQSYVEKSSRKVEETVRSTIQISKTETEEHKTVEESADVVSSAIDAQQLLEKAKREEEEQKREEEEEERRKQEEERKRKEEEERITQEKWRRIEEEERKLREEEERSKKHVSFSEEQDYEETEVISERPLGRTVIHEEHVTTTDSDTPGREKITKEIYEEITEEVLVQERIRRRDIDIDDDDRRRSLRDQVEVHQSLRDQAPMRKYGGGETLETSKKHVQFMKQTESGPQPIPHSAIQNSTPQEWKSQMVDALTTASDRPYTPLSKSSSVKEVYTEETIYLNRRAPRKEPRAISPFQAALMIAPERSYTPLGREIDEEDQHLSRSGTPSAPAEGYCPPADILYSDAKAPTQKVCKKKEGPRPLPTPPPDYRFRETSASPVRSRPETPKERPSSRSLIAGLKKPDTIPSYQRNLVAMKKTPVEGRPYTPCSRTPTPTSGRTKSPADEAPVCSMRAPRIRDEDPPSQERTISYFPGKKYVSYKVEEDTADGHISQEYSGAKSCEFTECQTCSGPAPCIEEHHSRVEEKRYMKTSEEKKEERVRKALEVTEELVQCEKRPQLTQQEALEFGGGCSISTVSKTQPTLPCPMPQGGSGRQTNIPVKTSPPSYNASTEVKHVQYDSAQRKSACPETGVTVLPCKAISDKGSKAGVVVVPCDGPQSACKRGGICVAPTSDRSGVCVSPCFNRSGARCGQPSGNCGRDTAGCDFDNRNCTDSGVCVIPNPDGSISVAPCNKPSQCPQKGACADPSRANLPFPHIPLPYEEGCLQSSTGCSTTSGCAIASGCATTTGCATVTGCTTASGCSNASGCCSPGRNDCSFEPIQKPRTNLSGQLARLTAKRDIPTISLYKPQAQSQTQCNSPGHCAPSINRCQTENHCQDQVQRPSSKTQRSVDPPNLSSHPDLGTGIGGLGGAGSKSGSFAGSSAPKRGRGILNQAGGAGSRLPLCGHCNSYVRGPFITALGQIWCPDHFVCVNTQCRRPLQDIGFVEEKGQLYCEYCFERFIAPSCNKCNNKIKGDCLNAIGKHFHPECFNCSYCGKLFGNSPFFLEEGLPYCEADWNELFTTKCFACGFPVEAGDRWVEALNNNYHSQCFNCTMCKKNLEGQSFYAKGGRPFCKNHAR